MGRKPKKGKDKIKAKAVAKRGHNLSPWRLGRGNPRIPRYLWQEVQDDSLRTDKECKDLAKHLLEVGLLMGVECKTDIVPHYRLEELDPLAIRTDNVSATFAAKRFTLPLVAGEYSSIGYLKRTKAKGGFKPIKSGSTGKGGRG
jgi:hypothetical protein